MKIFTCILGMIQTNCYLLLDEATGKAAVIDPGAYETSLLEMLNLPEIKKVEYILLTHGHFDHILGLKKLKDKTGAAVAVHSADANMLKDPEECRAFLHNVALEPVEPDVLLSDGDEIQLGELKIKVMHTPGHTPGGVCYICEDVMFSGDTLFAAASAERISPTATALKCLNPFAVCAICRAITGCFRGTADRRP